MKKFYIVENYEKPKVREFAETVEQILLAKGASVQRGRGYIDRSTLDKDIECIITLGGDGTLISAARDTAGMDIPLIGFNKGHLGFLTSLNRDEDLEKVLDSLLCDDFSLEDRMMIEGHAVKKGIETKKYTALNEVVLNRVLSGKAIRCKVYVNGEFLNEYNADGIIIATPTGSTAYNLSAGGPVVEPSGRMLIITPICPHALGQRSVVVSPDSEIDIEVFGEESERIALFDGEDNISLGYGEHLIVKESALKTRLIKLNDNSFFDNLRNKMRGI